MKTIKGKIKSKLNCILTIIAITIDSDEENIRFMGRWHIEAIRCFKDIRYILEVDLDITPYNLLEAHRLAYSLASMREVSVKFEYNHIAKTIRDIIESLLIDYGIFRDKRIFLNEPI